jgi:uncharacterized protein (DUF488 family)
MLSHGKRIILLSMKKIKVFTIGFAGSSAEHFFARIRGAGIRRVVDTRLWPETQLSGFARKKDLGFFLDHLCGVAYDYAPVCAPTADILRDYKDGRINWAEYETRYINILHRREVDKALSPDAIDGACFLCAEKTPHQCHRRLLVEYLAKQWPQTLEIQHI